MTTQTQNNSVDIVVPDIGDAENVEIIEILVNVGDQVVLDDSLVTLESDKASMEIPASVAGVVQSISVNVGDTVNSGDVIGSMSTITDNVSDVETANESAPEQAATTIDENTATTDTTNSEPASTSNTDNTDSSSSVPDTAIEANKAVDSNTSSSTKAHPGASRSGISPTAHLDDKKMRTAHASPGVRRYAREHGADLSLIKGSGPKERILKTDVTTFIKSALEGIGSNYGAGGGHATGIPELPEIDFTRFGEIERVELGRINKLSASNLHRASS